MVMQFQHLQTLRTLARLGQVRSGELAQSVSVGPRAVRYHLRWLMVHGYVERSAYVQGSWPYYWCTAKGFEAVRDG